MLSLWQEHFEGIWTLCMESKCMCFLIHLPHCKNADEAAFSQTLPPPTETIHLDNLLQALITSFRHIFSLKLTYKNVYTICLTSEIEVFCHISSLENSIKNINCLPFSKLMNTMLLFWFLVAVFVNRFRLFLGFWKRKTCLTYDPWLTCNFPWDSKKAQKPSQVKSERKMD